MMAKDKLKPIRNTRLRRMKLNRGIERVLKKHPEILVAYLYGSVASGREHGESDIDIGVLLKEDFKPDALYSARIANEICMESGPGREVDVRTLNDKSLIFLHQVLKYGRILLSKDERRRIEFETEVYDRYLDFEPHFKHFNEVRRRRLLA